MKKRFTGIRVLLLIEAAALVTVFILSLAYPQIQTNYEKIISRTKKASHQGEQLSGNDDPDGNADQPTGNEFDFSTDSKNPFEDTEEQPENTEIAVEDTKPIDQLFSKKVVDRITTMSVEEKVAQLFITTPEALTGIDGVTVAGDGTESALEKYKIAGLIYDRDNIKERQQTRDLLAGTQSFAKKNDGIELFLAVEEAGGQLVSPVASALALEASPSPQALADNGDSKEVSGAASRRAEYLSDYGFNMALAPSADLADGSSDKHDAMSYGEDVMEAADYIKQDVSALQAGGITATVKSFPGIVKTQKNYSVYQAGIDAGAKCLMVTGRASVKMTGYEELPCCLSKKTTAYIRNQMGYEGILMTADLAQKRVAEHYNVEDSSVQAVKAGMNLIYTSESFKEAYQAVLHAVNTGVVEENQVDIAVGRILTVKLESGK